MFITNLWFNALSDSLNWLYLLTVLMVVVLFSLPILAFNYRRIINSYLKDHNLYYFRRIIIWELLFFLIVTLLLILNYPKL